MAYRTISLVDHGRINGAFNNRCAEYKSEKDKVSSITKYLEKIRPHLHDLIDDLKKSCEWKIYLTMKSRFQ